MFEDPFRRQPRVTVEGLCSVLNEEQSSAVMHGEGPALVLAGAGSGKTRVIASRAARLHLQGICPIRRQLTVTFTRKAADEMKDRIGGWLGRAAAGAPVTTFHAFALSLLREQPGLAGLREEFEVADEATARSVLREILIAADVFETEYDRDDVAAMLAMFGKLKDMGYTPEGAAAEADTLRNILDEEEKNIFDQALPWFRSYQEGLRNRNLADFADMLLWTTLAMEMSDVIRHQWADRTDYIQVDEYQDTNPLQERFLRALGGHGNVFAVGDDSQAIYRFRGSSSDFILDFERRWKGDGTNPSVYRLETNYRCAPNILDAANTLIANNRRRLDKTLRPGLCHGEVTPIRIGQAESPHGEARWIAEQARLFLSEGKSENTVFVLYRANWMSRVIEESVLKAGLKYRIFGDTGYYSRQEIKDAIAVISVLENGDGSAWERVANIPARGIGPKAMSIVAAECERLKCGDVLVAVNSLLEREDRPALRRDMLEGLTFWKEARAEWLVSAANGAPFDIRVDDALEHYRLYWKNHDDPKAEERLDNLFEFLVVCMEAGSIEEIQARARRAEEAECDDAPLALATIHGAKGLEADAVFLPGWNERIIPSRHAVESSDKGDERLVEEERNLAYVALTRARKELTISWTSDGEASRFLGELGTRNDQLIDIDIPTLPSAGRPSTSKQRVFAQEMAARLSLPVPCEETLHDAMRVSLWIERCRTKEEIARKTGE